MIEPQILFRKFHPDAVVPEYQSSGAAGFDLHAVVVGGDGGAQWISPGQRALVSTQLGMAIPAGFEVQIRPRSGLALKHGVTVLNAPGTIDSDYRGAVGVILYNTGDQDFRVVTGDRIAQGVIAPSTLATFVDFNEVWDTERGSSGFGSTGQ